MLRAHPASIAALPAPAKRAIEAYLAATDRQLERAGKRFRKRDGTACYPYATKGGTTAVAIIADRIAKAAREDGDNGQWRWFVTKAARDATCRRFGVTYSNAASAPAWPARVQAADLALQAVIATIIAREGGQPVPPDVLEWATAHWVAARLPI